MPYTILTIDDSPSIAKLVEARLAGEPYALHYAESGEKGLALARQVRPDVILLDVEMPAPDGFEVCRRLKLDPSLMGIPVIFLTGSSGTPEKILGLELGAIDFLHKPFDQAELRARVRTALTIRRLSELLATRARVDCVTGLWNTQYFTARLVNELALAQRASRTVSVVLADIDHYRQLNQQHGQRLADQMLLSVADLFASACRGEDVLCRVDGAELGIICPGTDANGAGVLADRLRDSVSKILIPAHGVDLRPTVSVGVAGINQTPNPLKVSAEVLLDVARKAVEHAKSEGGGRVHVADKNMWPDLTDAPTQLPFFERRGHQPHAA